MRDQCVHAFTADADVVGKVGAFKDGALDLPVRSVQVNIVGGRVLVAAVEPGGRRVRTFVGERTDHLLDTAEAFTGVARGWAAGFCSSAD